MRIKIEVAEPLVRLITTPKRIKLAVGGRGGSKSIAFGDTFMKFCADGERLMCGREFQNSIDESVHALIKARIEHHGVPGFHVSATDITHASGGSIVYRGLSRNPESMKSLYGVKRVWVEEAQTLSQKTLELLLPTVRESDSEIWLSMNRGSSKDPIARMLLRPHEAHIAKHGFYEDADILIVQINWDQNPWFPDVLDQQRRRDFEILPRARYDHIWEGHYSDTVDDAIIEPDWFDACIDAHEALGFRAEGIEVVSHDPSGTGDDAKGLAYRHGAVILDVQCKDTGEVDEGVDWATGYANSVKADAFIWDADGMGAGLKRQVSDAFQGKKTEMHMFNGSAGTDSPDAPYEPLDGEVQKSKSNRETFLNKRAQYYWHLRDRIYKTYLAVKKNRAAMYHVDDLISFSSAIEDMDTLRSEICRIPRKANGAGKVQIMSKDEMKKQDIDSPNMADAVMMTFAVAALKPKAVEIAFESLW